MSVVDRAGDDREVSLSMLILRTLARGPLHGYAIARRIKDSTEDALAIEEGSLYPALNRI